MNQPQRVLQVGNERGIHSRVATRLAEIARKYDVVLSIHREEESVDCSSILDVLAMGLSHQTEILVTAQGQRSTTALEAAVRVLTARHDP